MLSVDQYQFCKEVDCRYLEREVGICTKDNDEPCLLDEEEYFDVEDWCNAE